MGNWFEPKKQTTISKLAYPNLRNTLHTLICDVLVHLHVVFLCRCHILIKCRIFCSFGVFFSITNDLTKRIVICGLRIVHTQRRAKTYISIPVFICKSLLKLFLVPSFKYFKNCLVREFYQLTNLIYFHQSVIAHPSNRLFKLFLKLNY